MKKISFVLFGAVSSLVLGACNLASLLGGVATSSEKPTLSLEDISIKSLDLEGITFNCNYAVKNPYSVGISLANVAADISCNDSEFTSIRANEGVSIEKQSSKSNTFDFKVPYDSALNFAKAYKENDVLPFTIKGSILLDKLPVISTLTIPFTKNFDVPVFKPSFSLTSPKVTLPTIGEIAGAIVKGGVANALKSASLAKNLVSGNSISEEDAQILEGIDLNVKLSFDLKVKNEGSGQWKYLLNSCGIKTDGQSDLISLDALGETEIESSDGTIPLTATLNTLKAGKFIVQLLSKTGKNPTFSFDSELSFPNLSYAPNLPLAYSKEIPLSSVSRSSN